jgi:hypothetical protein
MNIQWGSEKITLTLFRSVSVCLSRALSRSLSHTHTCMKTRPVCDQLWYKSIFYTTIGHKHFYTFRTITGSSYFYALRTRTGSSETLRSHIPPCLSLSLILSTWRMSNSSGLPTRNCMVLCQRDDSDIPYCRVSFVSNCIEKRNFESLISL